ncbi:4-(cytidine 5'-diphospho)-2-C-methyl-D-erythritol kinase [Actibacterium sp. XHP0104]|uniref:4-(cytidine 5'-diphospho)-2-C-methyl-D-erythritol kinase n=1 Tax=Actibacterium sp. XHP0104 TaxID=2984335 RepID=UPI0021E83E62|nr:4-(cytidine 5'-diphospho)-2-C-methyl-D-erythritol kinase [Actibacterium sp. XHP0104]MCV2883042.1 4-(cytidine 5'-diphospho)-2-C-methyl-D-erythritol kinase [Actibacterium sp. XHP0104]
MIEVFAPAKINLSLHVTGQRADGYHLLDSLVTFGPMGDRLLVSDGNTLSLTVEGPEAAGVPADMNNLILKAAELISDGRGAAFTLQKFLPAASGIGGGSADAAAALRGLMALWQIGRDWRDETDALRAFAGQLDGLEQLGADVPMCLMNHPARVRGIGERLDWVPLGAIPAVLVNPRVEVSTPAVFKALASKNNAPMPDDIPRFSGIQDFVPWLAQQRNDLQAPAIALQPVIGEVLTRLEATEGAMLARMSGSGATCFAIYPDQNHARAAAEKLYRDHPRWWVAGGVLGDQFKRGLPVS